MIFYFIFLEWQRGGKSTNQRRKKHRGRAWTLVNSWAPLRELASYIRRPSSHISISINKARDCVTARKLLSHINCKFRWFNLDWHLFRLQFTSSSIVCITRDDEFHYTHTHTHARTKAWSRPMKNYCFLCAAAAHSTFGAKHFELVIDISPHRVSLSFLSFSL